MIESMVIVAASILSLLTLPGAIELAILTFAGILPLPDRTDRESLKTINKLAIAIPAHNEAAVISQCVRSLAGCASPSNAETSIVVIADNCTDATADIARAVGARVLVRSDTERRGKGYALNFAFEILLAEQFDAVIVVDADTVADSNLLTETVRLFRAGADGVQARYAVLNPEASIRTRLMNVAFMAFNVLRPRARERMGLSAGILGNGFGLTRSTLEAVPYNAHSIVEDLEYHLHVVQAGKRIAFADRTCVRGEIPAGGLGASTQRARWEGGRLRVAIEQVPGLIRGILAGRLALLEPLLDLLLLPLAFHATLLIVTALLPFGPTRMYAIAALALLAFHVLAAIAVGGGTSKDLAALLGAPAYVAWKLAASPKTLKSAQALSPWVRTNRE
jgi:cellulose synthase/poly-beta-1,6-N-acetylglucosamine synthase-like glycosyltransferase